MNDLTPVARDALFAIAILALFALLLFVQVKLIQRARTHHGDIHELPGEDLEEMRNALGEWLRDARIVAAMVTTKTATRDDLQKTLLLLPMMGGFQIKSTMKSLLRVRDVRRVIALQFMRLHAIPKEDHWKVIKSLAKWGEVESQPEVIH